MVRVLIGALLVCAAVGLFLGGRASASGGVSSAEVATREAASYERGLGDGLIEGRALEGTRWLHGRTRQVARAAFRDGYAAGANDVFGGFDGGWRLGAPYVVSLASGKGAITYRIATRAPAPPGCRAS
jgi:hypothetical protein